MKLSSDLCDTCQRNNYLIMHSGDLSEGDKPFRLRKQEQHLCDAKSCRNYYRSQCDKSSELWN